MVVWGRAVGRREVVVGHGGGAMHGGGGPGRRWSEATQGGVGRRQVRRRATGDDRARQQEPD